MKRFSVVLGLALLAAFVLGTGVGRSQPTGSIVGWGKQAVVEQSALEGIVAVAAGWCHSLGLKSDGSIVAWGLNDYGQCDVPAPNGDFVAVAAGYGHSLGLKSEGSIVAWGLNNDCQCHVPAPNGDFVAVAAGEDHSLGLKSDGSIVAWGDNNWGQCDVPAPNGDFVALAAGEDHSLGLKSDGSIVAWGYNYYGQCDVPAPNGDFVAVAGGGYHSLGLKTSSERHGVIAGTVKDSYTQGPIGGALVEAMQGENIIGSGNTASDGRYSISNLPAGTYNVRASKDGYETKTENDVAVTADQTTTVDFELNPSPYFIHLTDTHYGYFGTRANVNSIITAILNMDPKPRFVLVTGDILSWGASSPGLPPGASGLAVADDNDYNAVKNDFQYLTESGIPVIVCPGNHDYYKFPLVSSNLNKYDDYFPIYSDIDVGNNMHVIGIPSGGDYLLVNPYRPPVGNGLSSSDISWMEGILDSLDGIDNDCDLSNLKKVIIMHHPTINYMAGATNRDPCWCLTRWGLARCDSWDAGVILNNRTGFMDLCDQYDVDVVCSGHIHWDRVYDRSMDGSSNPADQRGYSEVSPEGYLIHPPTSDTPLYVNTGAAGWGWYRRLTIEPDGIKIAATERINNNIQVEMFWPGYISKEGRQDSSGCPAALHLYDSANNHVGRNDTSAVDFEIEGATYYIMPLVETEETDPTLWEGTIEEISVSIDSGYYRYEIRGIGEGSINISAEKNLCDGSRTAWYYDSVAVTENCIGNMYIQNDSVDYTIYMDDNGDGIVDREIEPDTIIVAGIEREEDFAELPKLFSLYQNYPNPFNSTTQIKYTLHKDCQVRLEVYNILGQRVATLVDGKQRAGYKTVRWDAGSFASGIYLYRLEVKGDGFEVTKTKKMILLK